MLRSDFYYDLPKELIAQHPAQPRDSARLLALNRTTGETRDLVFTDVAELLCPGDVLVVNDSRVIPARLLGRKWPTGAAVELLLLRCLEGDRWECLAKPGKRLKTGARAVFTDKLSAEVVGETPQGNRIVEFTYDHARTFYELLDEIGEMPLPHYITAPLEDNSEYQTVYAQYDGSAAAPTAGLHFTDALLRRIEARGVEVARVTLHVGLGTFRPVKAEEITDHHMHSEAYVVTPQAADAINRAKAAGGRVIAVGTTSCRVLESVAAKYGEIRPCSGETDIFIYPGYSFRILDGLITNFHLPESTLIMLVSAFAGYEHTMAAYRYAVAEKYRFFSFGDAMFIADDPDGLPWRAE